MNNSEGKVLIVDTENTQQLLKALFTEMDFECVIVESLSDLSRFSATFFDIVLIRIDMPEISGFEVFNYLKSNYKQITHTPIVACSAYMMDFGASFLAGFHSFLRVPLNLDKLPLRVESILANERVWDSRTF